MGRLSLGSIEQMLEERVYLCFYSRVPRLWRLSLLKLYMLTLTWELNLVSGNNNPKL